jgi:TonB family protein
MTFAKQLSWFMPAALLCGVFTTLSSAQQTAGGAVVTPAPAAAPAPAATPTPAAASVPLAATANAAPAKSTPPLTEDALRARYVGKLIFLRGSYLGDDLNFDQDGKVNGSPTIASFTLSAFEVRKVKLSKHKLEFEADRYGLHYFGALPYEDESKSFDKVKISKKPVHITIARELIVVPKVKKEKKKKNEPTPQEIAAAQTLKTRTDATATAPPAPPTSGAAAETYEALAAVSPAHSAMLMNKALDNIFAGDMDQSMLAHLPDYWQEYFKSKSQHRQYMPADANVKVVSEGVTPPKVLNSIDPSSNEYAQKYGIAGMELLRTVVDASGTPRQIAIARPIGFGLDEKAVDAVKKSHFRPAMLNGQAVPVVIDMVVTFRIYSNRTKPGSVAKGAKDAVLAASVGDADGDANLRP